MPNELFHLTTVARVIGDGVELSEAINFPEVPGIAVQAFATGLSLLTDRVKQHVQLVPARTAQTRHAQQLAELARITRHSASTR